MIGNMCRGSKQVESIASTLGYKWTSDTYSLNTRSSSMFCEGIHVPTSVGIVGPITGPFTLLFGVLVNTVVVHVSHI